VFKCASQYEVSKSVKQSEYGPFLKHSNIFHSHDVSVGLQCELRES